jgi:hypothetical protein
VAENQGAVTALDQFVDQLPKCVEFSGRQVQRLRRSQQRRVTADLAQLQQGVEDRDMAALDATLINRGHDARPANGHHRVVKPPLRIMQQARANREIDRVQPADRDQCVADPQ